MTPLAWGTPGLFLHLDLGLEQMVSVLDPEQTRHLSSDHGSPSGAFRIHVCTVGDLVGAGWEKDGEG